MRKTEKTKKIFPSICHVYLYKIFWINFSCDICNLLSKRELGTCVPPIHPHFTGSPRKRKMSMATGTNTLTNLSPCRMLLSPPLPHPFCCDILLTFLPTHHVSQGTKFNFPPLNIDKVFSSRVKFDCNSSK